MKKRTLENLRLLYQDSVVPGHYTIQTTVQVYPVPGGNC